MKDRIYLLVRCTVETRYRNIHDALAELQSQTKLKASNTVNVKVLKTEVVQMNTKSEKGKDDENIK